jgi:lysine biosynthesis protein LysW
MNKSVNELTVICPSCHSRIQFSKLPRLREIIVCNECDETLEVVRLRPLRVDWSLLDDEFSWADADADEYEDRFDPYDR